MMTFKEDCWILVHVQRAVFFEEIADDNTPPCYPRSR